MANGARFTTPALADLDRRIAEAAERAASRERAVFAAICAQALERAGALAACAAALAALDVAQGCARLAEPGRWCCPQVTEDSTVPHRRRPPPGGRGGAVRHRRLRAQRLCPAAGGARAAAHRPQHGRQVHLPAAERADRGAGAGRPAGARRARRDRRGGPAVFPRRRRRRPGARAQHIHGGNDRDRRHPAPGRTPQPRRRGRDRPRHRDARRAGDRLGGAGGVAQCRALPCHISPRISTNSPA